MKDPRVTLMIPRDGFWSRRSLRATVSLWERKWKMSGWRHFKTEVRGKSKVISSSEKTRRWRRFHDCTAPSLCRWGAIINTESPLMKTSKWLLGETLLKSYLPHKTSQNIYKEQWQPASCFLFSCTGRSAKRERALQFRDSPVTCRACTLPPDS